MVDVTGFAVSKGCNVSTGVNGVVLFSPVPPCVLAWYSRSTTTLLHINTEKHTHQSRAYI